MGSSGMVAGGCVCVCARARVRVFVAAGTAAGSRRVLGGLEGQASIPPKEMASPAPSGRSNKINPTAAKAAIHGC